MHAAGKTTLLRDVSRQLADRHNKLVMVVDTSGDIAGGERAPHACIGSARRIPGGQQQSKSEVLYEAAANHGPEVQLLCRHSRLLVKSRQHISNFVSCW